MGFSLDDIVSSAVCPDMNSTSLQIKPKDICFSICFLSNLFRLFCAILGPKVLVVWTGCRYRGPHLSRLPYPQ